MIPSRNMSIVSLGATWGSSLQCSLGNALPTDPAYNDGYDDTYSATQHWLAMDAATTPNSADPALNLAHDPVAAEARASRARTESANKKALTDAAARETAAAAAEATHGDGGGGSCTCLCPPGRGFGKCYNLPAGAPKNSCDSVLRQAEPDCPTIGVARQCHTPSTAADLNCSAAGASMRGDIGSPTVWGGHVTCKLAKPCAEVPGSPGFASANCECTPKIYGGYACHWSLAPCEYTPYFPAGTPP